MVTEREEQVTEIASLRRAKDVSLVNLTIVLSLNTLTNLWVLVFIEKIKDLNSVTNFIMRDYFEIKTQ